MRLLVVVTRVSIDEQLLKQQALHNLDRTSNQVLHAEGHRSDRASSEAGDPAS